jgi:hypothetical protein
MIKKVGDWGKAEILTTQLEEVLKKAAETSLMRVGLYAEGKAKKHIANQDLGWKPLRPATLASKRRRGVSTKTYVDSSTYFQSITSFYSNGKAFVGVKKTVSYGGGLYVADIARILEFGNSNMSARPLWAPTLVETTKYWRASANPATIAKQLLKSKR